ARAAYWLRIENGPQGAKTLRARWSPNALKRAAAPYRTVLQQHARMIADAR
nr:hypothetical protein [Acidobacteriota bacterium]